MTGDWRNRLRGDPTKWLVDAEDSPSVYFWFQRDIVGRPEDAPALAQAREKILYSTPVQEIFAAQNELGYWGNSEALDEPRHRATLWSLALLAELGIPRDSRRARAACEFVLSSHLHEDGSFNLADERLAGLLARALVYFNYQNDPRLKRVLKFITTHAERGNIFALWALTETLDAASSSCLNRGAEAVLNALARDEYKTFGALPSFDALDALLALRVLSQLNRASDERAEETAERIWERQGDGARWVCEKSYADSVSAHLEEAGVPSKWATLNVLRIVTKM